MVFQAQAPGTSLFPNPSKGMGVSLKPRFRHKNALIATHVDRPKYNKNGSAICYPHQMILSTEGIIMRKMLLAIAALGAVGAANAQSNLTIYGSVDVNYSKETGSKATMNNSFNEYKNYLGFMGSEDLGGGLKATFQLERRFSLPNGEASYLGEFEGAANVGLAGSFGHFRFGRVNELSTETYRLIDPFQQYGAAGMITSLLRGDNNEGRLSSAVRYDSPVLNGFKLGASYSLKGNNDSSYMNDGWALSGTYTNGPAYLVANYNRAVNTDNSYNWNLGGSYAFGPARLSLGYEKTELSSLGETSMKTWIAGLSYKIGNGAFNAAYNQSDLDLSSINLDYKKYGLGYTHNLSKRTSLYATYAHNKFDYSYFGNSMHQTVRAIELGMTHKF